MSAIKAYLSNLHPLWSIERQREAHAAGTPGWPGKVVIYQDVLTPAALKAHSPRSLVEREQMLRPSKPRAGGETIYLATWGVADWTEAGFQRFLAAAAARGATVVSLETGVSVPPTAGLQELVRATDEFRTARIRAKPGGRKVGLEASKIARATDKERRIKLIADDWPRRDHTTAELLLRAGSIPKGRSEVRPMAYTTAKDVLGHRPARQKACDRALERERRKGERKNG